MSLLLRSGDPLRWRDQQRCDSEGDFNDAGRRQWRPWKVNCDLTPISLQLFFLKCFPHPLTLAPFAHSNTFVISAFDTPEWKFNVAKKVFQERDSNSEPQRFAKAEAKSAVFRERYLLIEQRLLRHQSFTKPFAVTKQAAEEYYQVSLIAFLLPSPNFLTDPAMPLRS